MNATTNNTNASNTKTTIILALSLLVGSGCAVDAGDDLELAYQESGSAAILLPAYGTGQDREVMSTFDPLVVTLHDTLGEPIANATITFTAPMSGAASTFRFGGQVETDADGRAEIRPYANQVAGTYLVWAHADGASPMPFVLTNTAASPASITPILGNTQGGMINQPFAYPLTVEVRDNYGNLVEGAPVQFVAPTAGPTTMMSEGGSSVTDDEGRAAVFATAGSEAGTYTVLAKVAGAPTVAFTLWNMSTRWVPTYEKLQDMQLDTTGTIDIEPATGTSSTK